MQHLFTSLPQQVSRPETLVVGSGPYVEALSSLLDGACLHPSTAKLEPPANENGGYDFFLNQLQRVIHVSEPGCGADELLRVHDGVWKWIDLLTKHRDCHSVATLFLVPELSAQSFSQTLPAGLGLEDFSSSDSGFGMISMNAPLAEILRMASGILSQDLQKLRGRRNADLRFCVLRSLLQADTAEESCASAIRVKQLFHKQEYLIDFFCLEPSHPNGNQLRKWLDRVVTQGVTPLDQEPLALHPRVLLNTTLLY